VEVEPPLHDQPARDVVADRERPDAGQHLAHDGIGKPFGSSNRADTDIVNMRLGAGFHRIIHPMQGITQAGPESHAASAEHDPRRTALIHFQAPAEPMAVRYVTRRKLGANAEDPTIVRLELIERLQQAKLVAEIAETVGTEEGRSHCWFNTLDGPTPVKAR